MHCQRGEGLHAKVSRRKASRRQATARAVEALSDRRVAGRQAVVLLRSVAGQSGAQLGGAAERRTTSSISAANASSSWSRSRCRPGLRCARTYGDTSQVSRRSAGTLRRRDRTEREYDSAALRLGTRPSAAVSSKYVGRCCSSSAAAIAPHSAPRARRRPNHGAARRVVPSCAARRVAKGATPISFTPAGARRGL